MAASAASSAGRFACTSEMTATFTGAIYRPPQAAGLLLVAVLVELGQVLDALLRLPLGVVVTHRIDQLLHEAGREVDPRHDDARHLLVLDLVVDPGEGDGELVVGVADVGEVGVDARHDLRGEMDVQMALAGCVFVHGRTLPTDTICRWAREPSRSSRLRCSVPSPTSAATGRRVGSSDRPIRRMETTPAPLRCSSPGPCAPRRARSPAGSPSGSSPPTSHRSRWRG